jgi:hypothetical protein
VVTRRGRGEAVCARGAWWALLGGPSTSPLVVMAQLIGLVGTAVIFIAGGLYTRYVFRRFGPPQLAVPWLHGKRLALFWLAIVLTVVVVIPAVTVAVGYVLGMTGCRPQFSPSDPWRCSPIGRLSLLIGMLAIGLPLAAIWMRFLLGILARDSKP